MLEYKADLRTLAVVALYFATLILGWLYFPEQWYFRLPIIAALCVLSFMCTVIVHNTIHHPIFRYKWLNKVFQIVLSYTYGHSVSAFVSGHNFSHHQHTQKSKDRIRSTQMKYKWNFLNQFMIFFQNAPGIMKDENEFAMRMMKEKPRWFAQYVLEMVLVLGVKFGLLFYNWEYALLLIFVPHLYAAWGIVGTNYWQHDGCDETHPYNHSRNFTGVFLNFIAFNNGYHTAHHNNPYMHWSLLPAYHEKEIVPNLHPNLNQKRLLPYLWKTCIWPAKRLDYLGNPVILDDKVQYEDWIPSADVEKYKYQLGVEQ
ncbi:MAG: fatty acid desaturase [Flavobacteriales bacterium]|nr:fatty acid desaturase [Flavobacteriales bacterium]